MEITPMGWASLITRAMPELLEHNQKFSAYYIHERTSWSEMEVDIINWYLRKMYRMELPLEVLTSNVYLRVSLFDHFGISLIEAIVNFKEKISRLGNSMKFNRQHKISNNAK